jgi:hypothetical protein
MSDRPKQSTRAERAKRHAEYRALYEVAHRAGLEAAERAAPHRLVVDADRGQPVEIDAVGFAWVRISPGNRGFGRWLSDNRLASTGHPYGVDVWPPDLGGTALAPKASYCRAFADVLRAAGVVAYDQERLD